MHPPMILRVLRASDGSPLLTGTSFVIDRDVVVGRSPEADIVLPDSSVSRKHLRIVVGPPLTVAALTDGNGTFHVQDETPIGSSPFVIPAGGAQLQLGGVLVSLAPLAATDPVWEVMKPARSSARFEVVWDADQCLVRCGGADLPLNGAAARFFGLLAERVGEVVHHWDLEQEVGTPHLAPVATLVRRALAEAHDKGHVDLWEAAAPAAREGVDDGDLAALGRRIVQSRRGHGYALLLRPEDIDRRRI
ncbi:MAG: FHA domain-containing protein [Myxococcota bacterium]